MDKLDELTVDNVKDLSIEDLQKLALSGKDELISSRGVIGNLNKQIKGAGKGDDETKGFTKEDMENYLADQKRKDELDSFISGNTDFEDKKEKLSELMGKGLSLDEAKGAVLSSDETLRNNVNTNQGGISGDNPTGNQTFSNKQSFEDYNQMSTEEKGAYKDACNKNYGGLTFSDTQENID